MTKQTWSNVPTGANHRNNCAIVACAALAGLPYQQVHDEFVARGIYKPRNGTTFHGQLQWLRDKGFIVRETDVNKFELVDGALKHNRPSLAKVLREASREVSYLIITDRHAQAWVRGKHVNTSIRRRSKVRWLFEIVAKPAKANELVEKMIALTGYGYTIKQWAALINATEKRTRNLIDAARRQGWTIVHEGGGKFRLDGAR